MMSKQKIRLVVATAFSLLQSIYFVGCNTNALAVDEHNSEHDHDKPAKPAHEHHHVEEHGDHNEGEHHAHEGHGETGWDLHQSVEDLFAKRCEHDIFAHACDECRYEVGVVEVKKELIDQGLIEIGTVLEKNFDNEIVLTGEIGFDERRIAHLGPRATGIVSKVHVDVGERVRAGQVLAEMDSTGLAETESAYLEALAEQRMAENTHDRKRNLSEAGISAKRELLEAKQQLDATTIRVNAARQKILRMGNGKRKIAALTRSGIKGAKGRLLVTAPFDGEVLELHAVRGEQIEADSQMLLIGDVSSLWLWAHVYERDLAVVTRAISTGTLDAIAQVAAFPKRAFAGRVDFLERVMDEHTRTVKARIVLENPDGLLRPGMFATARLGLSAGQGNLAVPSSAVLADEDKHFVFVKHGDDYFVRRPVSLGKTMGGFVEIHGDLRKDQVIATGGTFLLKSDVLRSKMGAGCAD